MTPYTDEHRHAPPHLRLVGQVHHIRRPQHTYRWWQQAQVLEWSPICSSLTTRWHLCPGLQGVNFS